MAGLSSLNGGLGNYQSFRMMPYRTLRFPGSAELCDGIDNDCDEQVDEDVLSTYYADIDAGRLPVERGYGTSEDDQLRKHVILELMCNLYLDRADVEAHFGIDFAETFAIELDELAAGPVKDGFVIITDEAIEVTAEGQLFVRNVCMPFDRYLREKSRSKPTFSRTV